MSKTFFITTPIYYPNGEPHLGHVYTTIATDAVARFHRLAGDDTFFLTGTDEHGIKMVKTAAEQNISPGELADRMVAVFRNFWKEIGITNDDFLRTTEPRHKTAVQEIIRRLLKNDDIYLGSYEGWYDEGQEEFVTETDAKAHEYKSAISGRPLTRYSEKSYFFRLKKYVPRLLQYIEQNPEFIQPTIRRNEVLSKLKQGVEDFSISRATLKWGIPLPNDPDHVVYVWIDALSNYITALGYASADQTLFEKFWPADMHVIGKEILWFHTVYWPAILFSLNLPLPKKVFAHGWWTSGGKKNEQIAGEFHRPGQAARGHQHLFAGRPAILFAARCPLRQRSRLDRRRFPQIVQRAEKRRRQLPEPHDKNDRPLPRRHSPAFRTICNQSTAICSPTARSCHPNSPPRTTASSCSNAPNCPCNWPG